MNWRTIDVPKRPRRCMRRIAHALVLTILMLSSGCLGLMGNDDELDTPTPLPELILTVQDPSSYSYNQRVLFSGQCNCPDVDAIVSASIPTTAVQGIVSSDDVGDFTVDFGILPSGTYTVQLTMTTEIGQIENFFATVTISPPPESPVAVTPYPPVIYAESGENSICLLYTSPSPRD